MSGPDSSPPRAPSSPPATFQGIPSVSKLSLPDQVFFTLRDALMSGRFEPGQRMPVRTIANTLGTSTMPAREAVNRLIAIGALESLANRRVSVPRLTADRYADLANARAIIESAAGAAAAPRLSAEMIDELTDLHVRMRQALARVEEPGGHVVYLDLNKRFHFLIYHASGSAALLSIIETLWLQVGPYLNLTLDKSRDWFKTDQHLPILQAAQARDPRAVERAIGDNITYAAQFVLANHRLETIGSSAEIDPA